MQKPRGIWNKAFIDSFIYLLTFWWEGLYSGIISILKKLEKHLNFVQRNQ